MADDKLRQELLYMVKLTSKYDLSRMEVVEGILRLENERQILGSVFGKRFKGRIFDVAAGVATDDKCVICGQHAENHIICQHCIDTIGGSEYAKSKFKAEEEASKKKLKFPKLKLPKINLHKFSLPKLKLQKPQEANDKSIVKDNSDIKVSKVKIVLQAFAIVCLTLILFLQVYVFSVWRTIPDYNPKEKARVSEHEQVPVNYQEEAYDQLELDFPEEEGYTITYSRMDVDYTGRFLLNKGDCCLEIEEQLSDEEKYDYFLTEEVYVFYISYLKEHTGKLGIAEINKDGSIIIEGSFNDGRRTDSFYKFR